MVTHRGLQTSWLALGILLAGCTGSGLQLLTPEAVRSGGAAATRGVCQFDEAKAIVEGFLGAISQGNGQAVATYFGPQFLWYSATFMDEPHFVAYEVQDALNYLQRRYELGEQLALREFHLTNEAPREQVNFWYVLDRTLEGKSYNTLGKGAMDCETRQIFVWSMGYDSTE